MCIPDLLLIVGGFLLIFVLFFLLVGFRLVSSWQEVKVEMRGDSGRKSPRRFTRMLIGFLKWLERHMQCYQIPLRFATHIMRVTWEIFMHDRTIFAALLIFAPHISAIATFVHVLLDVGGVSVFHVPCEGKMLIWLIKPQLEKMIFALGKACNTYWPTNRK